MAIRISVSVGIHATIDEILLKVPTIRSRAFRACRVGGIRDFSTVRRVSRSSFLTTRSRPAWAHVYVVEAVLSWVLV